MHLRGEHGTKDYVVSNVSIGILAPEKKSEGLKPYIDHTGNRGIKLSRLNTYHITVAASCGHDRGLALAT